jgi:hypothetical protein
MSERASNQGDLKRMTNHCVQHQNKKLEFPCSYSFKRMIKKEQQTNPKQQTDPKHLSHPRRKTKEKGVATHRRTNQP